MQEPDFHIAVDIAAPPDVVWAVISDVERWHEWTPSVRSIRLLGGRPLDVGTRALVRQPKFPPVVWTVTALEPGSRFVWRSGAPGMRVHAHHSVEPMPGGTRARLHLHYEGPLGRLLARWTRRITTRYLQFEAEGLKRRSESRNWERPATSA
jgi:uncharacterized membrane protein